MKLEDKINLSNLRLEKAEEFLNDAEFAFKNKRYLLTANRSYYAVFHGILSLLAFEGIQPTTHKGIKFLFNLKFVKTKIFPEKFSKYLEFLIDKRRETDYELFLDISKKEAEESLKLAKIFLKEIKKIQKKLIKDSNNPRR